ncbi:hypothetical protein [Sulfitobacter mediterraneus]|uniref:hypothetical protein n=1 Tax=Sulfitobacter mediterraneus TaxID=83219 RepID=UPI001EEF5B88|nr:hypothetical protein [Sulfitobacter mediterraneus]
MGYRFRNWKSSQDRDSDGSGASGTKSYHNGGVEGSRFSKWYDQHLAAKFADDDGEANGSGSGGTRGSGSGGTKGSGSGGTKGSGSGGTKGSGSGGTRGSGSGGTKGSGSGGTKGSGSGGTKGSGSGGTKGSGSGGTKGSGSGGTKGSGSGGTKGSGSGGTKGSGSGGTKGSGSGGTKGSGSGGTKGSGSGGTKGSGSGGTKGSGSGGTRGSGSGGTKGSGSGGTRGSGSGGTKGSGSGGTKGSGSGGTKGSGSGGTKGSGSGGTRGSGSGGTRGSGSGGTKGSGSGGTKGSGSGGTKGSGSGGTRGSGSGGTAGGGGPVDPPANDKSVLNFVMGDPAEINISVTETPHGQLHFNLSQTDFADQPSDIDGIFFDLSDDSKLSSLNFYPEENSHNVTDIQADANGVSALPNGAGVGQNFDVGLQFGTEPDSSEGSVNHASFTLWSDDGPVTVDDIDLNGMRVIVDSDGTGGEVLGVSGSDHPDFMDGDGEADSDIVLEDVMSLMSGAGTEEDTDATSGDEMEEFII